MHIRDYFSKYGFCDGDSLDMLAEAARARRNVVVLLNEKFEGTEYTVIAQDSLTSHNWCRLSVVWGNGEERYSWELNRLSVPRSQHIKNEDEPEYQAHSAKILPIIDSLNEELGWGEPAIS